MNISGKEILEVLTDLGFENQGLKGNHFVLNKGSHTILVPDEDELAERTVIGLIDQAGLSSKDILKLLKLQKAGSSVPSLDGDEKPSPKGKGFFGRAWHARAWAAPLAAFRVLLGVLFIISALEKAPWLPTAFGWLKPFLEAVSASPANPLMKMIVDSIVLPGFSSFGWFQFIFELLFGLSLVLGLFTVLSSFLGMFWVVFFSALAVGLPDPFVMLWAVMWISSVILMWTMRAGRSFGIDQAIAKVADSRKEESGFWRFISWLV